MNIERVLVDAYSIIHAWPDLRARKRRSLSAARDEFIRLLTKFADESGLAVTIVFDGGKSPPQKSVPIQADGVEVVFSMQGRTADEVIERRVATGKVPERILVVTDDGAERRICEGFGAQVKGAEEFRCMLLTARTHFLERLRAFRARSRALK